jgi:signal transduction histidine kinase/pSer/pThr/pTyr-binding forkhead associated (FHA) protein
MASLYVVRGRDQGKHFVLRGSLVRLGRDARNDVQLLDGEASRKHAEIRIGLHGDFEIVDLNSSNGTLVNGNRVEQQELASGDRIEIGGTLLIFTGTGQPSAIQDAHGVDIVQQEQGDEASRIVSSLIRPRPSSRPSSRPRAPHDSKPSGPENVAERVSEFKQAYSMDTLPLATEVTEPEASASDSPGDSSMMTLADPDRSLEVMYLTALAVGRTDDLDELLNRILRLVFDWVDADRGCIMLRDGESGDLRPAARCDREPEDKRSSNAESPISISSTILDYVLHRAEGVRTSDATDDARFDATASIVQGGIREALCVPLQGRYDIVGALYIDTYTSPGQIVKRGKTHRFNDDHLRLITAIGHQAALAIEDTFYYSALLQSERLAAMGQTIATLSHHVKNILQGIRGGSYLIEAGLKREDTDAVRRGWSIVDRNQERISNLVMDMLTFSKERVPQRTEADLNETVGDVVELMATRANNANVKLEFEPATDLPEAYFDPEAFHQAILNLVTNAIDAVAQNSDAGDQGSTGKKGEHENGEDQAVPSDTQPSSQGRVRVTTCYDSERGWLIDVIDNGPGVSPEDRKKIFSLFESRKGARGTGLGLPVSAKILNEHGGEIEILDPAEGTGCVFRMRLPAAQVIEADD